MPPRPSIRRRLLRATLVVGAGVVLALWLATVPYDYFHTHGARHRLRASNGAVSYGYAPSGFSRLGTGLAFRDEPMRWMPDVRSRPSGSWGVSLPLWVPFCALACPAALLIVPHMRKRPSGSCPTCGYDLAGLPQGVCPECGAKV